MPRDRERESLCANRHITYMLGTAVKRTTRVEPPGPRQLHIYERVEGQLSLACQRAWLVRPLGPLALFAPLATAARTFPAGSSLAALLSHSSPASPPGAASYQRLQTRAASPPAPQSPACPKEQVGVLPRHLRWQAALTADTPTAAAPAPPARLPPRGPSRTAVAAATAGQSRPHRHV